MSSLEKINIYVPEHIGVTLDNDARMFEILKNDGTSVNRNRFLSMLISGYYNAYVSKCQRKKDAIIEVLVNYGVNESISSEISSSIIKNIILPEVPSRKGKNPTKLSLKPTKDTEGLILNILKDLGSDDYISQYFCRLFMSYCEQPFSTREQIIFKENYDKLKLACENHTPISFCTIWNKTVIHTVIPYKLAVGHEEMFNYLLCAESFEKQEARTYRLNRISKIICCGGTNQIENSVTEHLDKMLKYGPQYMINDNEETCVRLTDAGKRNFSRIYYGRPQVDRIEEVDGNAYYYFRCSKDQIFFYFRRFGDNDAEIISPESLRKKIAEFHLKAYENYT